MQYETHSAAETEALGEALAHAFMPPHTFCLIGDLGAGKTAFTRGLARGYGFSGRVMSPTFTLLHIYDGSVPIHHFDLYRLSSDEELDDIDFDSYLENGITVIEWPNAFMHRIGRATVVRITAKNADIRQIETEEI